MDSWLNCPVFGFISWPKYKIELVFNEYELILLPLDEEHEKSLHLKMNHLSYEDGMTVVNRFISTLCWKNKKSVEQVNEGDGTSVIHPFPVKTNVYRYISYQDPFPQRINGPQESKQQLALSLYREGLSLNSIPYQFLSFFKILNIEYKDKYDKGKHELKDWITNNMKFLKSMKEKERISEIISSKDDFTDYIYTSCRCAIAHAYATPVVDPDNIQDLNRLQKDLVLIRGLAEIIIDKEMDISSSLWE